MDETNKSDADTPLDKRALRNVLGTFATGVTVITTVDTSGRRHGITANSFSSVSLEPPLVLWSQSLTAPSYPMFRDAMYFGISILSEDQVEISNGFAKSGADKFLGVETIEGIGGVPLVANAAAHLECRREASYPGGDHAVFMARVARISQHGHNPLVFASGRYMVAAHHGLRKPPSGGLRSSSLSHLHGVRLASTASRELAAQLDVTIGVGVWGNHGPTIVSWEESRNPVSFNLRVGMVLPIFGSATGLVLAAFLPDAVTARCIAAEREGSSAEDSVTRALLGSIRSRGIAEIVAAESFTQAYETEVNAISVPVFDASGEAVLALTALEPTHRRTQHSSERITSALIAGCAALSEKLGHPAHRD